MRSRLQYSESYERTDPTIDLSLNGDGHRPNGGTGPREQSRARTYARYLPLVPVEARGCRVRDRGGRWLLDCLTGAGALSLGYGHPVLREALLKVLAAGVPLQTLDFPTPLQDRFFEELFASLPPGLAGNGVVHLCAPSGANAVEAALTLAEMATGGIEHVALEGGFHGCTRAARSISSGAELRKHQTSFSPPAHFLPFPQAYRCPFGVGGEEGIRLAIDAIERLLFHPAAGLVRPASILAEFVLGEGGSIPAPARWIRALREKSLRAGVPLIADEIQTGVGRTGTMWAFEHGAIEPDILIVSKGLGGGVPIAVIVLRAELNRWEPGSFTGTFRGGALGFAAAAAVLRYVREEELPRRAAALGDRLVALLLETQATAVSIGEVRGRGLMVGAEIVDPLAAPDGRGVRPPAPELARLVQRTCYDLGLIVEVGGSYDNVVRFLPPLVIEEAEIHEAAETFDAAVRAAEGAWLRERTRTA